MMNFTDNTILLRTLQKESPILTAQIRALYGKLDRQYHLQGAKVPITFGFETDSLGSYTRKSRDGEEQFHFSLLFVGYGVQHPLKKADREDLYLHEYAHYMQHQIEIPKQYQWQSGTHGSAWKYCCSLIGAAPTPYYRAGEALLQHDYHKVLKNPIHDRSVTMRDTHRREMEYRKQKNREVQFRVGDEIEHPKFGAGCIEKIEQMAGSVRLHVQFGKECRVIDQKWLLRTQYQKRTGQ